MEMRSGARAAPVWGGWRCFLRGYVAFYAQATGIQEENQIGRGAAKKFEVRFRAFWSAAIAVFVVYWPVYLRRMRTRSLVVLALWFFTLCLKPVKAAGSGTLEVIMHNSDAVHGKQSTYF